MTTRLPTFFISHGGGPWPWMDDMMAGPYAQLAQSLRKLPTEAGGQPRAILMVSAHWEESIFSVQSHAQPPMVYDYYGFPEHTYHIRYASPGDPLLASQVVELLQKSGLNARLDKSRGYDHGMYAPMAIAYPHQDMPIVQLSLQVGLDPQTHLDLGRSLAPLRDDNVLLIGSGLSYHNLRTFGATGANASAEFDRWLHHALALPPTERMQALLNWEHAPSARLAHPREEHLLPLMVAIGAAENDLAHTIYHQQNFMGGITASSFQFGASATHG